MNFEDKKLLILRQKITESLRIQRDSADPVPYIDSGNILSDVRARQNHAIFARRGCGKTLLLHHSSRELDDSIRTVYLNCEDWRAQKPSATFFGENVAWEKYTSS